MIIIKINRSLLKSFIYQNIKFRSIYLTSHQWKSSGEDDKITEVKAELNEIFDPHELDLTEKQIEKLRNKSYLTDEHRKLLHNEFPSIDIYDRSLMSPERLRSLYGHFGNESQVPIGRLWPSVEELSRLKDYERVHTEIKGVDWVEKYRTEETNRIEETLIKQNEIALKMQNIREYQKKWKSRIKTMENLTREKMIKKKEKIDQVRKQLGRKVKEDDDKFQAEIKKLDRLEKEKRYAVKMEMKESKVNAASPGTEESNEQKDNMS